MGQDETHRQMSKGQGRAEPRIARCGSPFKQPLVEATQQAQDPQVSLFSSPGCDLRPTEATP